MAPSYRLLPDKRQFRCTSIWTAGYMRSWQTNRSSVGEDIRRISKDTVADYSVYGSPLLAFILREIKFIPHNYIQPFNVHLFIYLSHTA